jgi:DNA-binding CsgD family transcriptional regulator
MHSTPPPDHRSLRALASLKLTPREAEVLFWISEGKSNQDIGVILGASTGTICKHVEHILGKLNVENRTAAAVIAVEKCHSLAQQTGPEMGWPQIAIVGFIVERVSDFSLDICEIYNTIVSLGA